MKKARKVHATERISQANNGSPADGSSTSTVGMNLFMGNFSTSKVVGKGTVKLKFTTYSESSKSYL